LPDYLRQLHFFRGLGNEQAELLAQASTTCQLEDGRWLFRRGDSAREVFVLREGQIALFRLTADGGESIVALVGADEIFGEEMIQTTDARRDVNARAVGRCTVVKIDRQPFRGLLAESPELMGSLVGTLHRRQQMLLDHIERLSLRDASGRLVDYLLASAGDARGTHRMRLQMPKHALASHLAIQPETLSRAIGRLKNCGHLREEDDVFIIDADGLRAAEHCGQCERIFWGCAGPSTAPVATAHA